MTLDWRWVFVVNVPVGIATVALGLRVLPQPPARPREPLPDLLGAVLLTVAVAALTGALVEAPTWGWTSGGVAALLVAAVLGSASFVARSLRHTHPLVELHLFRVRRFAVANAGTIAFSAAFAIMLLSNSLWCQDVWHYSALRTGFAMAPGPLMVPFVTAWSQRLARRVGLAPLIAVGSLLFAAGLAWRIAFAQAAPDYVRDLLPSMIITGVGVGLASELVHRRRSDRPAGRTIGDSLGHGELGAPGRLGARGRRARDGAGWKRLARRPVRSRLVDRRGPVGARGRDRSRSDDPARGPLHSRHGRHPPRGTCEAPVDVAFAYLDDYRTATDWMFGLARFTAGRATRTTAWARSSTGRSRSGR